MQRHTKNYTMVSAGKVRAIVDTTDTSPINVQVTGHGLATGDRVTINGHTTNVAANGTWIITKVDANNFTLDGSTGSGAGAGGADGCVADYIKPILVEDFRHILIQLASDGGGDAAFVLKFVGSIQDECPDFAAARAVDNHFEYIMSVDKQTTASVVAGDTGITWSSADDYRIFEINTNGLKWLSVLPTAGSAGEITIVAETFDP